MDFLTLKTWMLRGSMSTKLSEDWTLCFSPGSLNQGCWASLHGKLYMGLLPNFNCKALILGQCQLEGFAALDSREKAGRPA